MHADESKASSELDSICVHLRASQFQMPYDYLQRIKRNKAQGTGYK
jgi:hypothetical protein